MVVSVMTIFSWTRRALRAVMPEKDVGPNSFSLSSQIGGPNSPEAVLHQEQRLRVAFNSWKGNYTAAIRKFAFILRVDGSIVRYTEVWNMVGAQNAKRKKDWVEVEIGVPESWWLEDGIDGYKRRLVESIETGFHSMVELLGRNRHKVAEEALFGDWHKVKDNFLADSSWRYLDDRSS
jgi:hypothetical protein